MKGGYLDTIAVCCFAVCCYVLLDHCTIFTVFLGGILCAIGIVGMNTYLKTLLQEHAQNDEDKTHSEEEDNSNDSSQESKEEHNSNARSGEPKGKDSSIKSSQKSKGKGSSNDSSQETKGKGSSNDRAQETKGKSSSNDSSQESKEEDNSNARSGESKEEDNSNARSGETNVKGSSNDSLQETNVKGSSNDSLQKTNVKGSSNDSLQEQSKEDRLRDASNSLKNVYCQNITPRPLPWREYLVTNDGKDWIVNDQLRCDNLFVDTNIRLTSPDKKTEEVSCTSFIVSEKYMTLKRVLIIGDIGCGKTSFVKHACLLWSKKEYDNTFIFYIDLQRVDLNENIEKVISEQLPKDCNMSEESIMSIIGYEKCLLIFDSSNKLLELNQKHDNKTGGVKDHFTVSDLIWCTPFNDNLRVWVTSRPCPPSQLCDLYNVVDLLPLNELQLKSYIMLMCAYYKTLQNPLKRAQDFLLTVVLRQADIGKQVWKIIDENSLLNIKHNLLIAMIIQLLVSEQSGFKNKQITDINHNSFPSIIKTLVNCLHKRHTIITNTVVTFDTCNNLEIDLGREFQRENITVFSRQVLEKKITEISVERALSNGLLKLSSHQSKDTKTKNKKEVLNVEFCHEFIQEYCIAKYFTTDEKKLKSFLQSLKSKPTERSERIILLVCDIDSAKSEIIVKHLKGKNHWSVVINRIEKREDSKNAVE